jgi:hypothetical protein
VVCASAATLDTVTIVWSASATAGTSGPPSTPVGTTADVPEVNAPNVRANASVRRRQTAVNRLGCLRPPGVIIRLRNTLASLA